LHLPHLPLIGRYFDYPHQIHIIDDMEAMSGNQEAVEKHQGYIVTFGIVPTNRKRDMDIDERKGMM
jgi:hypothetical protein